MKIILQANSNNFKIDNLEYGYSFNFENSLYNLYEQPWCVKIGGMLEKLFFKGDKLKNENIKIADLVVKSSNFLSDNIDTPELLEYMKMQININSSFNKFVKKYIPYVEKISSTLANELSTATDINAGYININSRNIVIGTDLFSQKDSFSFPCYIKEKLGLENAVFFVVFHEASHSFHFSNNFANNFGLSSNKESAQKLDKDYSHTLNSIISYSRKISASNSESLNELNKLVGKYTFQDKNVEFKKLDKDYFKEIYLLQEEIYADAGAILLLRNKEFINNSYKKEESLQTIDVIIEARQKSQFSTQKNSSPHHYVSNFNHLTSPGIEYLKENYDSLPQRVMTQSEINLYSKKCVQQGVSRTLISSIRANDENAEQLRTLLSLKDTTLGFLESDEDKKDNSLNFVSDLEKLAAEKWVKNFNDNVKKIETETISKKIKAIWHAGINLCEFKNDLDNIKKNNVLDKMHSMRKPANNSLTPSLNY